MGRVLSKGNEDGADSTHEPPSPSNNLKLAGGQLLKDALL